MSAREELIRSVYALRNMSQNDMEKLVDAYAHELAERQRDAAHIVRLVGLEVEDAVRVSAALIDPEVSDG